MDLLSHPVIKAFILIIVVLGTTLFTINSLTTEPQETPDNSSTILETKVGDFNVTSIKMNETQILWEGLTTDFKPNTTVKMNGKVTLSDGVKNFPSWKYKTNIYGFRSESEGRNPIKSTGSNFTVLIVGASPTVGHYVRYQNTYPEKLEEKIQQKYPEAEVINGGTDMAGIIDYYLLIKKLGPEINPDVVIMGDIDTAKILSRAERKKLQKRVYDRVEMNKGKLKNPSIKASKINLEILTKYMRLKEDFNSPRIKKYTRKIHEYAEKEGIKLYFYCHKRCFPSLQKLCSRNNISLIDKPKAFQNNLRKVYRYSDRHLTIKGHDKIAKDLYNSINWTSNSSKINRHFTRLNDTEADLKKTYYLSSGYETIENESQWKRITGEFRNINVRDGVLKIQGEGTYGYWKSTILNKKKHNKLYIYTEINESRNSYVIANLLTEKKRTINHKKKLYLRDGRNSFRLDPDTEEDFRIEFARISRVNSKVGSPKIINITIS